jgi:hypothetical protein
MSSRNSVATYRISAVTRVALALGLKTYFPTPQAISAGLVSISMVSLSATRRIPGRTARAIWARPYWRTVELELSLQTQLLRIRLLRIRACIRLHSKPVTAQPRLRENKHMVEPIDVARQVHKRVSNTGGAALRGLGAVSGANRLTVPGISQDNIIFAAVLFSFLVWITSKGELPRYISFFNPSKTTQGPPVSSFSATPTTGSAILSAATTGAATNAANLASGNIGTAIGNAVISEPATLINSITKNLTGSNSGIATWLGGLFGSGK